MVKIKLVDSFEDELYVSKEMKDAYKISDSMMSVYFGNWNKKMKIITDEQLPDETIELPKGLEELFTIPTELPYELIVTDDKLIIGPVIAYTVNKRKRKLTIKSLRKYKSRFDRYKNINGLIYVCAADGIDVNNKTVEGFYYNPQGTNEKDRWISGTFPYPGAMYKRVSLPDSVNEDLQHTIGNKIFNLNFFNKWQLYQAVSSDKKAEQFVPETRELKAFSDLKEMIEKHNTIYMKPMAGMQGKGIFAVMKTNKGLKVVDRKKDEYHFNSMKKAEKFISRYVDKKHYLLQQGVQTTFKNQHVDFRLYMQKNASKKWTCQGIVGRFARKKSIITNIKFVDYLLPGNEAIMKLFKVENNEAGVITDQMVTASIDVCKLLDQEIGHFGDVAVDSTEE